MSDPEKLVETIKEEFADAAKAVVADVKSIAAEVADVIAEEMPHPGGGHQQPAPSPGDDVRGDRDSST